MSDQSMTLSSVPAQASAAAKPVSQSRARIPVIDVLRGLVMVVMLFDHTRETIYLHMQVTDPMTLETTAPALFFTRFAAHFCAPMFVFLTGLSAWLYAPRRPVRVPLPPS